MSYQRYTKPGHTDTCDGSASRIPMWMNFSPWLLWSTHKPFSAFGSIWYSKQYMKPPHFKSHILKSMKQSIHELFSTVYYFKERNKKTNPFILRSNDYELCIFFNKKNRETKFGAKSEKWSSWESEMLKKKHQQCRKTKISMTIWTPKKMSQLKWLKCFQNIEKNLIVIALYLQSFVFVFC